MWSQPYLQRSLEVVGAERILFSTDYPYQYRPGRPGRLFIEDATLSSEQKELFAHGNWDRLMKSARRNSVEISRQPSPLLGYQGTTR
jgi:hypothetical protein